MLLLANWTDIHILQSLETLVSKDRCERTDFDHNQYKRHICTTENDCYKKRLPWKSSDSSTPENEQLTQARLTATTKRLEKIGKLQEYHQATTEQIAKMVLEPLSKMPKGAIVHYIPHHLVTKEEAETTRLRTVFDCSWKVNKDVESLENGPALQPKLFNILVHNVFNKFVVTGDMKKAVLKIRFKQEDKDAQILWYNNVEERQMLHYRIERVIFSVT